MNACGNIFKKIKHEHKDFSSQKRDQENCEQNSESVALNVLFSSQDSEEITLVYKSGYNLEPRNKVLLLMINDDNDDEKYYYFAVKNSGDNWFENALNDALDYQSIKKDPQKIPKLKPYINQYN